METNDARGVCVVRADQWGPDLQLVAGNGSCREIVGARSGLRLRSLYSIELGEHSELARLKHPGEAVYYVIDGVVTVRSSMARSLTVGDGGMIHVAAGTDYVISTVDRACVVGGPSPVDPRFGTGVAAADTIGVRPSGRPRVRAFHRDNPGLTAPLISADARLVVWYGIGAITANMNYVVLEPGERNQRHLHPKSEDTIFILEGHGSIADITHGVTHEFGPRDTVTVPPKVVHAVAADRGERVASVGGPSPADLSLLTALGVDLDRLEAAENLP